MEPLVEIRNAPRHGRLLLIQSLLVSICFDRKLIEIFHLVKVICEILVYQLIFHHPSHVFTFESMSTSFFSWLDPSTLMLSPLRLSLPPLSVSLLVGAGWSRVLNPPSCVTQQSQRHSCWMERGRECRREGSGSGAATFRS